jgi:gluconolactonase
MAELPVDAMEIFARGLDHPEGLAFDGEGYLWAGGEAGQLYRIDPIGRVETVAELGGFCVGLAFSPARELYVSVTGRGIIRLERSGEPVLFAEEAPGRPLICPNFPVFDRQGRLYLSDSGEWRKREGAILRFQPDGRGEVIGGPFGYASGLALDAAETSLWRVESDTPRVYRFDLRGSGPLGTPQLYADAVGRLPDGLAVDETGNLFVACYASDEIWEVTRKREKCRVAFDRHGILLKGPTNLAFGGPGFDELFIANISRTTITRLQLGRRGLPLAGTRGE